MWTNRTKSYATQTQTYTNPNTSNLLRVNYNNITSPGTSYINGPYNYTIPYPNGCISTTIKDGGSLLCNTIANPCTDEVIETTKVLQCYPTTCSDVPGTEQLLCWDSQLNTWYPRQRYVMPTSGTGWPEGYKGFVSAEKPPTPVLTLDSSTSNSATLSWTVTNDDCIPISSYNIYLNGQIYTTVSYTTTTITISGLYCSNSFNVTSVSNTTESDKSNTVTTNNIPFSITGGGSFINTSGTYTVTFTNDGTITFYCSKNIQYTLVGGGASGGSYSVFSGGSSGGGGGQVLNTSGNIPISPSTLTITIGQGGPLPNLPPFGPGVIGTGIIGGDTSISGLPYPVSTQNSVYGGCGGLGASNYSWPGGGGTLNIYNSDGGTYNINLGIGFGSGGAAGSLTYINASGLISLVTKPSNGDTGSGNNAGNGSSGFAGINGVIYGGGGGGGLVYNAAYTGGLGGNGGGGYGANRNGISGPPATVTNNTGGGGGGGALSIAPAAGGSGIAIIQILP